MKQNIDNWDYIIANTPEENEEDNVNMQSKDLKKE